MSDIAHERAAGFFTPEERARAGAVSHDEAYEALTRFNNSHWNKHNGGERARYSIPADVRRDDDIRLAIYIQQNREAAARISTLERENADLQRQLAEAKAELKIFHDARIQNHPATPVFGKGGEIWLVPQPVADLMRGMEQEANALCIELTEAKAELDKERTECARIEVAWLKLLKQIWMTLDPDEACGATTNEVAEFDPWDALRTLSTKLAEAKAEIERLSDIVSYRGIVTGLRTADGVPITLGMTVFGVFDNRVDDIKLDIHDAFGTYSIPDGEQHIDGVRLTGHVHICGYEKYWDARFFFSTREAALASLSGVQP